MQDVNDQPIVEKPKTGIVKTTLAELGPRLPVGILDPTGASLSRQIVAGPWKMPQDRELGALRDSNRDMNLFQYVGIVLSVILEQLGEHKFSEMELEDKQAVISRMFYPDVMYSYIWLRRETMGNTLVLDFNCNKCGRPIEEYPADLDTLVVTTVGHVDDGDWEYELLDPFKLGGQEVAGLKMGLTYWHPFEALAPRAINTAETKAATIEASVRSPVGSDMVLAPAQLDELSKRDIETLMAKFETHHIGPNMAIDDICPHCKQQFRAAIEWSYDSFFGVSSG